MYDKHQYMQESECKSTMIIYNLKIQYEYTVIADCDIIYRSITSPKGAKV